MFHTWGGGTETWAVSRACLHSFLCKQLWIKTLTNIIMVVWLTYTQNPDVLLPVIIFCLVTTHNISTLQQPEYSRARKSPTKRSLFLLHSNTFKHKPPVKSFQVGWQLYPADFPSLLAGEQLSLVQPAFSLPVGKAMVIRGEMNNHGAKPTEGRITQQLPPQSKREMPLGGDSARRNQTSQASSLPPAPGHWEHGLKING